MDVLPSKSDLMKKIYKNQAFFVEKKNNLKNNVIFANAFVNKTRKTSDINIDCDE